MPISRHAKNLRPRKRPLQARAQRTVEIVLKATAQVFARRGYAGATTNHIAERAGVSIGTLYEYFPNKDALLVALMEAHLHEGEAVLASAMAEVAGKPHTLAETLRLLVRAMVDLHAHERDLHRVLFEEAPLPRQLRRMLVEIEERITAQVEMLLRHAPEVSVPDPALAAAIVVKTVESLTHNVVIHGESEHDLDVYVEEIVRLVGSYLTVNKRPQARVRRKRG